MSDTLPFPNHFLLRRLHSLTGIVPIGAFLMVHLLTNASVVWGSFDSRAREHGHGGVATFQHEVNFIHSLPFLLIIEIFGLWVPIAFHSILGVAYAMSGKPNVSQYGYPDNWRYVLQRVSGYVGILFIFYHVATLRWGWTFLIPGGNAAMWDHKFAASTMALALRGDGASITAAGLGISIFYFLGVSLLVFHFANGLWTAAITWGITISKQSQQRWGLACTGLGLGLLALSWAAIIGFATINIAEARVTESAVNNLHSPEASSPTPPSRVQETGH